MSHTAVLIYNLNEEGRKKSILAGGNGKEEQQITTDATPEILSLGTVDSQGNVTLDLRRPERVILETVWKENTSGYPEKYRVGTSSYTGCYDTHGFSETQTVESLITYEKERRARLQAEFEEKQAELPQLQAEWMSKFEARKAEEDAVKAEREAKKQAEEEKKKKIQEEKEAWIKENGSDYLKDCLSLGYRCNKEYVTERAQAEFPGFTCDYSDSAEWEAIVSPSREAIDEVKTLKASGADADIVWLGRPPVIDDEDPYWKDNYPREAVVIYNFLGKYDLVKEV